MRKNKKKSAEPQTPLGESLEKRLALYALAAGAAGVVGVGALAFPATAEAGIVYENPAISIGLNSGGVFLATINGAKATDIFSFRERQNTGTNGTGGPETAGFLFANPGNNIGMFSKFVSGGASIGPSGSFEKGKLVPLSLAIKSQTVNGGISSRPGAWANKSAYLGFEIPNSKGTKSYFAWARFQLNEKSGGITGEITGFAYDTVAGQPLAAGEAPEPPTLALLALGAVGLFALRKKKLAAAERESVAKS